MSTARAIAFSESKNTRLAKRRDKAWGWAERGERPPTLTLHPEGGPVETLRLYVSTRGDEVILSVTFRKVRKGSAERYTGTGHRSQGFCPAHMRGTARRLKRGKVWNIFHHLDPGERATLALHMEWCADYIEEI